MGSSCSCSRGAATDRSQGFRKAPTPGYGRRSAAAQKNTSTHGVKNMLIRSLVIAAAISTPGVVRAETAKPETTLRARAILRKYCAECHDKEKKQRGEISIMDRAEMERTARPFIAPKAADTSQLLRLIDDGSMPPGTRDKPNAEERQVIKEWINADAATFPRVFDDTYVLNSIANDVARLPQPDRPFARYFSLHNVIVNDPLQEVPPARDALFQAIADTSKSKEPAAVADPFLMVYRVDLRKTGWDMKPFKAHRLEDKKKYPIDSTVNLFDVILIEYPFGTIDANSPDFPRLVKSFLEPAGQVVPVTYLRGEWFACKCAKSAPAKDIREALDLPAAPDRPPLATKPVVNAPRSGTPIVPLDATTEGNFNPPSAGIDLIFETGYPTKNA